MNRHIRTFIFINLLCQCQLSKATINYYYVYITIINFYTQKHRILMKKFSLILLTFVLVLGACKKDKEEEGLTPTSTQNGFAINYTATWCGYCGDWGAPLIHKYGTDATKGVVICSHASGDPMNNSLYTDFKADRTTGGGIPSFWVGDSKTTADDAMTNLLASGSATAGVDYSYEVSGTTMTVKTKTKFFSPDAGDYYMSILILEDGINGNSSSGQYKQNGVTNSYPNDDYHHDFVLRASASGSAYGTAIATDPANEAEIDKDYTITIDPAWNKPYPVIIIWKYEPSGSAPHFKYINSLKKK